VQYLLCPDCSGEIYVNRKLAICDKGHEFQIIDGVVDLISSTSDENLLEEQNHWDKVADEKSMSLNPDSYMSTKTVEDLRLLYKKIITNVWPDYQLRTVCIGEIGCGSGSAMSYLDEISFGAVKYFGTDVSRKYLLIGVNRQPPANWNTHFLRMSANRPIFNTNSLDIIFCVAALHHLNVNEVIEWIAVCLKPGGLFILNEPTLKNPFARVGRKMIPGFHTKGETPLNPREIRRIAIKNEFELVYEKGLHFLTGPLEYLVGMLKPPRPIVVCSYYFGRSIDSLVKCVSLNYSFVQIYQKV
jgi:SAM-dependent methyltransferase